MFVRRVKKKPPKLNLIPILDSVFIFIFFLLMSAQFVEIYQIGSDAPAVTHYEQVSGDSKPLNLTLVIEESGIQVLSGVPLVLKKKIPNSNGAYDLPTLQEKLISVKRENREESSVRIRPHRSIAYQEIVNIIDAARKVDLEMVQAINGIVNDDDLILFENIIFENNI